MAISPAPVPAPPPPPPPGGHVVVSKNFRQPFSSIPRSLPGVAGNADQPGMSDTHNPSKQTEHSGPLLLSLDGLDSLDDVLDRLDDVLDALDVLDDVLEALDALDCDDWEL